ncbi:MAG TPA: tRNA pseudouridine(13) synthase TruD [Candidatus Nitrosotenuis sp.]|nr:tRNA pseudouridine(13) synthase TruD [Candidatus Nitrosotenuis sp.]
MKLPYVTEGLAGLGGRLRQEPEDFQVEELPAYEPAGFGEHLFLEVRCRDLATLEFLRRARALLGLGPADLGVAGLKDRRAVTLQRLSLPAVAGARIGALESLDGVLGVRLVGRHPHKLRRGHLAGNRFRIRLRGPRPGALEQARRIAAQLARRGWPNFYGAQRFGVRGDNARAGEEMLRGGRLRGDRRLAGLKLSALQAELFNEYLAGRMARGWFERLLPGDVCAFLPRGGMFVVEDPEREEPRLRRFEISATGPIFGYKMMAARGPAARLEEELLARRGLAPEAFRRVRAPGSRRRLRLPLEDLTIEEEQGDLIFSFCLPPGSYATVLLDEFLKEGPGVGEADLEEP